MVASESPSCEQTIGKEGALARHVLGGNRFMPTRRPPPPHKNKNPAERCSRIIAKPPWELAVKAWFYNLTNSLQQTTNDEGAFLALLPRRILTLVSNCRNLRSASPSFSKDGCVHTVKSVLKLAKRPSNVTPRISAHEIHFSHAKMQQNDSCIKS